MISRRLIAIGGSEERLADLIEERLKPGTDKEVIDKRIWDLFGEEWCIMFTDLSGFSRGVDKFGIIHFLQIIHESERIFVPILEKNDGILLKMEGDSFLVIFRNANKALNASIEMQKAAKAYNKDKIDEEKILLSIGLGFGKVLKIGDSDVFGAEVNAASKLGEDTGKAWEILVTQSFKDFAKDITGISYEEISKTPPGAKKAYKVIYGF